MLSFWLVPLFCIRGISLNNIKRQLMTLPNDSAPVSLSMLGEQLRYLYMVCCDAAAAAATSIGGEAARRGCFEEAEHRRVWTVPYQYPVVLTEGLRAAPVWELAELDEGCSMPFCIVIIL